MEGNLDIGLCEFKRMKSIDRDILIYNNLVHIRKKIEDYKFHKKLQYVWLSILTILLGLKKFMGI
jgi:hypothetical protein